MHERWYHGRLYIWTVDTSVKVHLHWRIVRPTACVHCVSKTAPLPRFYILTNSEKSEAIVMDFGVQNPE